VDVALREVQEAARINRGALACRRHERPRRV
jgi:hypothetical protein